LLRLACDGVFGFSDAPLRLATWLGGIVTLASLSIGACTTLWLWSVLPALAAALFFLGGVQLLCLGILGEYIGRIHNEVKGRPAYVIEELIGFQRENLGPLARSASEGTLAGASG